MTVKNLKLFWYQIFVHQPEIASFSIGFRLNFVAFKSPFFPFQTELLPILAKL